MSRDFFEWILRGFNVDFARETARLEREKTRKKKKRHTRQGLSFRFVQLELSRDSVVRLMCALLLHLLKSMNHYLDLKVTQVGRGDKA